MHFRKVACVQEGAFLKQPEVGEALGLQARRSEVSLGRSAGSRGRGTLLSSLHRVRLAGSGSHEESYGVGSGGRAGVG